MLALAGGFALLEIVGLTGCVYPNGAGGVTIAPPPLPGPPSVNINTYGTPTRYYYRENPVYMYEGRRVYYVNNERRYFRPAWYNYPRQRNGYYYYY